MEPATELQQVLDLDVCFCNLLFSGNGIIIPSIPYHFVQIGVAGRIYKAIFLQPNADVPLLCSANARQDRCTKH